MVDTAFVLAGGLGTRLSSVVSKVPKPMATVAGRPFLEHLLDYLLAQGVEHIVLCVGHLRSVIQGHFGDCYNGTPVAYSVEQEPAGTGGALSRALEEFRPDSPFLVCNGDTYFPIDISGLEAGARGHSWAVATFRTTDTGRYGALSVDRGGLLRDVRADSRDARAPAATEIQANSGVWIGVPGKINLPLLTKEKRYSLEEYMSQSLRTGAISAIAHDFDSTFIDIGLPNDFSRAQTMPLFVGR